MSTDITPLVAFGGLKESGKDAAAGYLAQDHGYTVLGMSDALHEAMLVLDPIVRAQISAHVTLEVMRYSELVARVGYTEAKKNPEVRRLLQMLGTDVGRKMIGEDVWVDIMRSKIQTLLDAGTAVAVTGIRFRNEIDLINELDGVSIWVDRPEVTARHQAALAAEYARLNEAHESENSLSEEDFNYVFDNDGTLGDLRTTVACLAQSMTDDEPAVAA